MSTAILILLLALMAVALGFMIVTSQQERRRQNKLLIRARRDAERQEQAILRLSEGLNASMRQVNHLTEAMEARQDRLGQALDGRLNESFKLVNAQLADVHRGLGEMRELTSGMTDLKKMLGGVKTRGIWGEVQLRTLMAELFAPGQYVENAAIPEGSQQRVEFALKLPLSDGGERLLPIDSKCPQEDYLRLVGARETGDRASAEKCAVQLERAVQEQARRIRDKYILPPLTVDFAVMFLPTESLYAEVAGREGLIGRVQERYRVLIAGPATFAALMTSLQLGIRSVALERRSGEVLKLLSTMKQDFNRFDESIQRMRQRLNQTSSELDALEARSKRVVRAIDNVDDLREEIPRPKQEDDR